MHQGDTLLAAMLACDLLSFRTFATVPRVGQWEGTGTTRPYKGLVMGPEIAVSLTFGQLETFYAARYSGHGRASLSIGKQDIDITSIETKLLV